MKAFVALLCLLTTSANAAYMNLEACQGKLLAECSVIVIVGGIASPDAEKFRRLSKDVKGTLIFLDSPGGNLLESLQIGEIISEGGYTTVVREGKGCYSGCALIWLAGSSRYLLPRSSVAFHSVYNEDTPDRASGIGNILVGIYLTQIGFGYAEAIELFGESPKDWALLKK